MIVVVSVLPHTWKAYWLDEDVPKNNAAVK